MMIELNLIWLIISVIMMAVSAVLVVLSRRRKDLDKLEIQHRQELEGLAATRKAIIEELRAEMAIMGSKHTAEIADLNTQIAELRGQYAAMRNFQVQAVIDGVTRGVLRNLAGLDPDEILVPSIVREPFPNSTD